MQWGKCVVKTKIENEWRLLSFNGSQGRHFLFDTWNFGMGAMPCDCYCLGDAHSGQCVNSLFVFVCFLVGEFLFIVFLWRLYYVKFFCFFIKSCLGRLVDVSAFLKIKGKLVYMRCYYCLRKSHSSLCSMGVIVHITRWLKSTSNSQSCSGIGFFTQSRHRSSGLIVFLG